MNLTRGKQLKEDGRWQRVSERERKLVEVGNESSVEVARGFSDDGFINHLMTVRNVSIMMMTRVDTVV